VSIPKRIALAFLILLVAEAVGIAILPTFLKIIRGWLGIWPAPTEHFSELVGNTAWPCALLLLAFVFKRNIGALIGSLRKFSFGDTTFEFGRGLDAAEAQASTLPPPPEQPQPPVPQPEPGEISLETAEISPALAIIESWLPIERQIYSLGAVHGYGTGRARSISFLLDRLGRDGVLDRKTVGLINQLRELRNIAVHSQDEIALTVEDARRYRELSLTVVEAIKSSKR
jgi:hypothetical protein